MTFSNETQGKAGKKPTTFVTMPLCEEHGGLSKSEHINVCANLGFWTFHVALKQEAFIAINECNFKTIAVMVSVPVSLCSQLRKHAAGVEKCDPKSSEPADSHDPLIM